jgi:hypothetical protein
MLAADIHLSKLQFLQTQGSHHWKFSKVHIGPRFSHGFQPPVCIKLHNEIVQATIRGRTKS